MTKEYICYELICDHCGKSYWNEDNGTVAMPTEDEIREMASEDYDQWMSINGRDLCPDCYHLNEETDEYEEND